MVSVLDSRCILFYMSNSILEMYKVKKYSTLAEPCYGGRDWVYMMNAHHLVLIYCYND